MRVFVYFNLRRKMWSVKALEGVNKGKVVYRSHYVILRDVTPKVSKAGRERVLREKRKNVHAGLVGEWVVGEGADLDVNARLVSYNPYLRGHFIHTDDTTEYKGSDLAVMTHKRVYAA